MHEECTPYITAMIPFEKLDSSPGLQLQGASLAAQTRQLVCDIEIGIQSASYSPRHKRALFLGFIMIQSLWIKLRSINCIQYSSTELNPVSQVCMRDALASIATPSQG
jgi:hypothetical protein